MSREENLSEAHVQILSINHGAGSAARSPYPLTRKKITHAPGLGENLKDRGRPAASPCAGVCRTRPQPATVRRRVSAGLTARSGGTGAHARRRVRAQADGMNRLTD
ncbi:hypothetical protein EVAR_99338_1 [Eumeta japonica]|uniref:Uncharacterized protein n=1 Tax=Eumeta variegata TaxID=151549 RepID=A0A4C1ZJ90_EUMVA|nr:hypothetical protein EVAR_99338_1 [Eumeta japonica]